MSKPSYVKHFLQKAIANTHESCPVSLGTLLSVFAISEMLLVVPSV